METTDTLQQAIDYARQGNATIASRLLARYVTQDPKSDTAWLWLAACLDDPDKQQYCLKRATEINPSNPNSIDGLASYISDRLVKPSRRQRTPKPESINLPAPETPIVAPKAEDLRPAKPARQGMSSTQVTILIILAFAVILVLAALGYVVFIADPNFLPALIQSLTGG